MRSLNKKEVMNFLYWEQASEDTIDFKRIYVDVAGDILAGLLLSQIIYWHLPNKSGEQKLRVEKDGHLWIAKGRSEWFEEIRLTARQFDRASKILEDKGLIEKRSEEHTSELQSRFDLVCRLLLEKKKKYCK